jgi:hypothetical protein
MEAAIETLIVDTAYRHELGAKAKQFAETNWAPKAVAARYLRLIHGDVPADWLFDPRQLRYLHGCGLPEARTKELVREVIACGGVDALQLQDKPELERLFVEFAGSVTSYPMQR